MQGLQAGVAARGEVVGRPRPALGGPAAHSLHLDGLRRTYGSVVAVDEVTLEVPRGEFLTLLGPSGSGKTTLLMMVAGFVAPSAGEIRVDDRKITHLAPERRNFGVVFQGYALFPHMSVAENIAYPLTVRGQGHAVIAEKVAAVLALVRLEGLASRRPRELSGGQQQRVAIARALVYAPDILLLDEPLGALDRKLRAEVQLELKALHARLGTTFLHVTHDQEEALSMADRVAIMDHGRIVQLGTPHQLYERPRTRFVADFLGKSNFITGEASGREGGLLRYATADGGSFLHAGPAPAAGPVGLALRPERLALSPSPPAGAANRVAGRVTGIAYLGATLSVTTMTETLGVLTATLLAAHGLPAGLAPGAGIWLSWPPEATVALEPEPSGI